MATAEKELNKARFLYFLSYKMSDSIYCNIFIVQDFAAYTILRRQR